MNKHNRSSLQRITISFVLFGVFLSVSAQNIYDLNHSQKYADFLFSSHQYTLAAEEYERIIFMDSISDANKIRLLQSYRLSNQFNMGIQTAHRFFPTTKEFMSDEYAREYTKILMNNNQYQLASAFLSQNQKVDPVFKGNQQLAIYLLSKEWSEAIHFISRISDASKLNATLVAISMETQSLRYKSPALSICLSAMVPGMGKIYSGRWQDGIMSFVFVAASSFAAYRGFSQNGANSVYGYVFSGMAIGFYSGNIYGSYKAAKEYNQIQDEEIFSKTKTVLHSSD